MARSATLELTPTTTAPEAYAARVAEVERLIAELSERLPGMKAPTAPVHWGHVGSTGALVSILEQALTFA